MAERPGESGMTHTEFRIWMEAVCHARMLYQVEPSMMATPARSYQRCLV
jgi:hypothetical protein